MSNSIYENDTTQQSVASDEKKINETFFPLKGNKLDESKKVDVPKNFSTKNLIKDININNNFLYNNELIHYEYDIIKNIKEKKNKSREKKNIFKVNYRTIHDGDSPDNIKQIIITNFINFFIIFVNFIISKLIKEEKIIFQIGYQIKNKIKLEDLISLTVEQLLTFQSLVNQNSKNINKKEEVQNSEIIKRVREILSSKLDIFFETKVINLFKDIYAREIKNENDKNIDLKIYGIKGLIFKLEEDIPTYQKKKEQYLGNKTKIKIMDDIVKNIFIIHPNSKKFKTEIKEKEKK